MIDLSNLMVIKPWAQSMNLDSDPIGLEIINWIMRVNKVDQVQG